MHLLRALENRFLRAGDSLRSYTLRLDDVGPWIASALSCLSDPFVAYSTSVLVRAASIYRVAKYSATVFTSLSPRPERFTTITCSLVIEGATLITSAIA